MVQLSLFDEFNVANRTQIEELKAQLEALELKASVQEIAISRWKTALASASEALKDLASVFEDPEVLFKAQDDVSDVIQQVVTKHSEYFLSARISSKSVREEQKDASTVVVPLFEASLPSPSDNTTILTAKQIELILSSELTSEQLTDFAAKVGVNSQRLGTIAKNLSQRNLTHAGLNTLINLARPLSLLSAEY